MFTLTIPEPKDAQQANAQADRFTRAQQIIADGYTFWPDAEVASIAVCKPGRLAADYFITEDGCDCPDMQKSGQPCKHVIAAYILQQKQVEEDEAEAAQVACYEDMYANGYTGRLG